jgi:CHAD domain-containing protein
LALAFLDQAEEARPRLADPDDGEGLHDFRVAVRRLRSCLGSYRSALSGSVPKKLKKRLRRAAAATGPGRDAEVQLDWLRKSAPPPTRGQRAGFAWLAERLAGQKDEAYGHIGRKLEHDFIRLADELRRRLSSYRAEIRPLGEEAASLAAEAARLLDAQGGELRDQLGRIEGPDDVHTAHEARIAAKRLRYLVDPWTAEVPDAARLVKQLKGLQDLLGELHDAHVLAETLASAIAEAASRRAVGLLERVLAGAPAGEIRIFRLRSTEPGLLALASANRQRRDRLYAALEEGWCRSAAEPFFAEAAAVARAFAALAPARS